MTSIAFFDGDNTLLSKHILFVICSYKNRIRIIMAVSSYCVGRSQREAETKGDVARRSVVALRESVLAVVPLLHLAGHSTCCVPAPRNTLCVFVIVLL